MTLHFTINYQAQWGQQLAVLYAADADITTASPVTLPMDCHGNSEWSAQVTLSDIHKYISYCYVVLDEQGNILRRESMPHLLECQPGNIVLRDLWQDKSQSLFASKVFSQVLFAHRAPVAAKKATGNITLKVSVPRLERHQGVAIMYRDVFGASRASAPASRRDLPKCGVPRNHNIAEQGRSCGQAVGSTGRMVSASKRRRVI